MTMCYPKNNNNPMVIRKITIMILPNNQFHCKINMIS